MLVNEHIYMTLLHSLQILFLNATYKFFNRGNQMHPQNNHSKHSFPVTPYMLYYQHCMTQFTSHSPWQNDRRFQDDIFGCIFREWKVFCVLIKFNWDSFLRVQLATNQHWCTYCLGAEITTGHYLKQCWPDSLTHIYGTRGRCVKWRVFSFFWTQVHFRDDCGYEWYNQLH